MTPSPSEGALAPQASKPDAATQSLSRLVGALAEDAIFAFAGSRDGGLSVLPSVAKRRADAYAACIRGERTARMIDAFDAWVVELARAMAPLSPPVWMPMADVVAEKVTLEAGARGLRSLFSSKPSDKDMLRVKRLGTLAVRVLRAVLASDGNVDSEEARTIAALVASLGLPDADAAPLLVEEVVSVEHLDVYTDIIIRPVDRTGRLLAFYTKDPQLSTCALAVVGAWRLAGIDEAETTGTYFPPGGGERDAMVDIQTLSRRAGAWVEATEEPPALQAGDAWIIAYPGGKDAHTGIATSDATVEGDVVHVATVEGGQAATMGSTASEAFQRTLTKIGGKWMMGQRELLGWASAAKLPVEVPEDDSGAAELAEQALGQAAVEIGAGNIDPAPDAA